MSRWRPDELDARVSDAARRHRHLAGSPDPHEVAAYAAALPATPDHVVVLGMTPELRTMAVRRSRLVTSVDHDPAVIERYAPWVASDGGEHIVEAGWAQLDEVVAGPVDAVLGDGALGNVVAPVDQHGVLRAVASVLGPSGCFVTRHAVLPDDLDPDQVHHQRLLQEHRAGHLDDATFGLGTRLLGHLATCWDDADGILDSGATLALDRARHHRGELTDRELAVIERYRFSGRTSLLPEHRWIARLNDAGLDATVVTLEGRAWYRWYRIYVATRRS